MKIFREISYVYSVVGDYINTMKNSIDFNFDLYQAVKHRSHEKLSIKKDYLQNCNLFINLACLSVCLFVSNKRQNGGTDRAQILCGAPRNPREGL